MRLRIRLPSWRAVLATALSIGLAGVAGAKALESVRGPIAPAWVDDVTRTNSDLVAMQFDLDVALNRRETLPAEPCWPCRAREALKRDPLSAGALRMMAMYEDAARRPEEAEELLTLSSRLSRRVSIVQLWQIERANRAGDPAAMVRHYDQAIAVRPQLGEVMFPQISERLAEPAFRNAFAALVRENRHWVDEFIVASMSNPENLRPLAAVFAQASPSGPVNEAMAPYEKGLVGHFAAMKDYANAYRTARRVLADDATLRDASFSPQTMDESLTPLLWSFSETTDVTSGLVEDGTLRVEALSAARGTAVYRVFILDPGRYRFQAEVRPVEGAPQPQSAWEATCLAGTGEGLLDRAEAGDESARRLVLDFTVARGCRAIQLSLWIGNPVGQDLAVIEVTGGRLQRVES